RLIQRAAIDALGEPLHAIRPGLRNGRSNVGLSIAPHVRPERPRELMDYVRRVVLTQLAGGVYFLLLVGGGLKRRPVRLGMHVRPGLTGGSEERQPEPGAVQSHRPSDG